MDDQAKSAKSPGWARALMFIPTLVWILCVALLVIYKPEGYKPIVIAFIAVLIFAYGFSFLAARTARKRKMKNG